MNKQSNMLVELSTIFLIIAVASYFILTSDLTSGHKQTPPTASDQPMKETSPDVSTITTDPNKVKWSAGKILFKSNCASCHNPKVAQTGSALIGVVNRWEDAGSFKGRSGTQWLHIWIKNWHEAVDAGYPYAINISHYSPSEMSLFPRLKDEEINDILYYVEQVDMATSLPVAVSSVSKEH